MKGRAVMGWGEAYLKAPPMEGGERQAEVIL